MPRLPVLLTLLISTAALPVMADQYRINPQLSSLVLNWQMIGRSEYHARISSISGEVSYDAQQDTRNRLQAVIPVDALDAHNVLLTRALKSSAFFNPAVYPHALFSSSRMVSLGEGRYRVFGSLQIKAVRKPLILYAQQSDVSAQRIRLSAQTTISRSSFGMGQYPAIVSDPIRVEIVLYADRQP